MLLEMPWSTPPPVDDDVDEVSLSLTWIAILKLTKHKIVAPAGLFSSQSIKQCKKTLRDTLDITSQAVVIYHNSH